MNIFLPYENDIRKSVQSLDDLRLNKQILECYQLLNNAIKEQNGEEVKGYKNHPIYVHYKKDIYFLSIYGYECCEEYFYRFGKKHKLYSFFYYIKSPAMAYWCFDKIKNGQPYDTFYYTPFYMEGSKGQPNYIRTTENVSALYQAKLIAKWENDKKPPKWTNREIPSFYKEKYNG
jgi:hypothetical protein